MNIASRMKAKRLSTRKDNRLVEISEDKIKSVLFSPAIYEYKDGHRVKIGSNFRVSRRAKIFLIDLEGKQKEFNSLAELSRFINIDRKKLGKYINKEKLFICGNNLYYIKKNNLRSLSILLGCTSER